MSDIILEKLEDKLTFPEEKEVKPSQKNEPIETIKDKIIDNKDRLKTLEDEIKNSKAKDKALMEVLFHDNVEEAKFIANNEELIAHLFALSMIEYVYTKYSKK